MHVERRRSFFLERVPAPVPSLYAIMFPIHSLNNKITLYRVFKLKVFITVCYMYKP